MPPKIKSEAEKQQAKRRILDAARDLFVHKGIDAVTMREIAKKIDYSPTTIYLYFKDKKALVKEICQHDFAQFAAGLNQIMQIDQPVTRMMKMGEAYATFALQYPNHYRMMFMTPHAGCNIEEAHLNEDLDPSEDAYQMLMQVVESVYEHGYFLPELKSPALIAQTVWAGIHGVCSLQINMGNDHHIAWVEIEARVQLMLSTMMRGLLKYTNYKSKL